MLGTRLIRIPADIAEMLSVLARNNPSATTAEIVDPILRRPVERLFDKLPQADRDYALARIARINAEPATAK